jgi:hypothetical protein
MGLLGLCGAILLLPLLVNAASGQGSSPSAYGRDEPSFGKDIAFRVTNQLSAQTQAAVFPRSNEAFSLTQRLWTRSPGNANEDTRQELASLRLSQQFDPARQQDRAFSRLTPGPLWADLFLEAWMAPLSTLWLSTTATYHPAAAHLARATAEIKVQPRTFWTLSLAPDFGDGSQLEFVNSKMQLTLPGAWTVSYATRYPTLDNSVVSHTVTTRYHSSYGHVRLQLAQSPEEAYVGILIDVATFLRRTFGF